MSDLPPPFDDVGFRMLVGLIIGLALGSFVTMLSYRLPLRLSLLIPSYSFCPQCKTLLKSKDLVPIISWLSTRGTCRYCHTKISIRYPLIELITALCCAVAFGLLAFKSLLIAVPGIVVGVTLLTIKLEKYLLNRPDSRQGR